MRYEQLKVDDTILHNGKPYTVRAIGVCTDYSNRHLELSNGQTTVSWCVPNEGHIHGAYQNEGHTS